MSVILQLDEERARKEKASKWLLWLAIISIIMFFGAFTSYYIVVRGSKNWLPFELPQMFWVSTAIIVLSSVTMNWAVSAAKKDEFRQVRNATLLTLLLGLAFGISQFFGWAQLYENNIVMAGNKSFVSGSILYLITFLHLVHVVGGLISLGVVAAKASKGLYSSHNMTGIKLCATYWHFMDALWVYLFLFLLFIR